MSIRWTEKQTGLIVPSTAADASNKEIGALKNYLRKHSRKFNAIFENAGL